MSATTALRSLLAPVRCVLLDFDGPVCSVFAGLPAHEVARRMLAHLMAAGHQLPEHWTSETDPLALLQRIHSEQPSALPAADTTLEALEVEAAATARPNPDALPLLQACVETGRSVYLVSNNAGAAIRRYLTDHHLNDTVAGVFGRIPGNPTSMKPNPRLLNDAMNAAGAKPSETVFIGDAARDVEAGDLAGVPTIGYANKPGKDHRLTIAGAAVVLDSLQSVTQTLSSGA